MTSPIKIKSLTNDWVKHLYKLRESRRFRIVENKVLVVGEKMVTEVSKVVPIVSLGFTGPKAALAAKFRGEKKLVSEEVAEKVTGIQRNEGNHNHH